MKQASSVCSIILALTVAVLGAGAGTARAAVILLDVSGSLSSDADNGFCGDLSGDTTCKLGGYIIIGNSTNAVFASAVTAAAVGNPTLNFTNYSNPSTQDGLTELVLETGSGTAAGTIVLQLLFSTPTVGSLVGYTGGPLSTMSSMGGMSLAFDATLVSGSLTEGTGASVPEPSTLLLMVTAIAGVSMSVLGKRLCRLTAPRRA